MSVPIGNKPKQSLPELTIPQSQGMPLSTPSGSDFGSQSLSTNLISLPSTAVTTTRRWKPGKRLNTLPVCFILTIQLSKANNSGSSNNIFWYQRHFRISFVDIKPTANKINVSLNGKISPMRLRSNSMTLIQHLVLSNCSESWLMRNISTRKLPGTLSTIPSHTPIIPSCHKHFKSGALIFWKDSCQDTWNSFIWSITSGWQESPKSTPEIRTKWMFFHWSKKAIQKKSEWPICVLLALTRSTA